MEIKEVILTVSGRNYEQENIQYHWYWSIGHDSESFFADKF